MEKSELKAGTIAQRNPQIQKVTFQKADFIEDFTKLAGTTALAVVDAL
jgi:hypothetical protein